MKAFVNVIFLVLLIFIGVPASGNEPVRAVQVFTFSSPDLAGLKGELGSIKAAGFNTIILRLFKNQYDSPYRFVTETAPTGVYYASETEPVVADVLTPVVKLAHQLDMEVFAWMTTRKCQWILQEHPEWDSQRFDSKTSEWIPSGQLDIFRSDVNNRLTKLLSELSESGVDGILIQDDMVSRQFDDFRTNIWRSYRNKPFSQRDFTDLFDFSEGTARYKSSYYEWTRHKSQAITTRLAKWINRVRLINPDIKIAVNLYYETVTKPHQARLWLSQDLEELLTLRVNFWAVMGYQRQISKELSLSIKEVGELLENSRGMLKDGFLIPESQVLWKLQAHDWSTADIVPEDEWRTLFNAFEPGQIVLVPYRGVGSLGELSRLSFLN